MSTAATTTTATSTLPSSSNCPITKEHVKEWASYGTKVYKKPTTDEEFEFQKQRSLKMKQMKKRLVVEFNDKKLWSERAIERELNKLVLEMEEKQEKEKHRQEGINGDEDDGDTTTPAYQLDNNHPDNTIDYRSEGGPLLNMLWTNHQNKHEPLIGQTLYLGGEVGSDNHIYCIPGHAPRVLKIDTVTNEIFPIGPKNLTSNGRLYKWLRGIVIGDIIYGIPCHANEILRIDVATQTITKLPIPYEDFYKADDDPEEAIRQKDMSWKYHGGCISPIDGCIYAIPQSACHVLKIDPSTETISFVGPKLTEGRWKWYGGIVGKSDGAIYGIPHNSKHVLRIVAPNIVTLHGDYSHYGTHKWHGGAAASNSPNGTIVSVPANADQVLLIIPSNSPEEEPTLELIGDASIIQSGRHRSDGKYKYLGATCSPNGERVYLFPCASEYVLQVDAITKVCKNVGPNLRETEMELIHQNKYQNGLCCKQDNCVYGMPLSGHTLLRIDCSNASTNSSNGDNDNGEEDDDPIVTTWKIPSPRRDCRDKFEGGVILPSTGIMYTVPNNHKAVLRIESSNLSKN